MQFKCTKKYDMEVDLNEIVTETHDFLENCCESIILTEPGCTEEIYKEMSESGFLKKVKIAVCRSIIKEIESKKD